jgi:hypothetical protein
MQYLTKGEFPMSNEGQDAQQRTNPPDEKEKKLSKRIKITFVIVITLVIIALTGFFSWYWPPRYIGEQWNRMKLLFGEKTILSVHVILYVGVIGGTWLLRRYPTERALQALILFVIAIVLIVNAWNVTTASRLLASQRAEEFSDGAHSYAFTQIHSSNRVTSDVIVLDQSIAKIVSYIHIMVRNDFPQFRLRAATLHLKTANKHINELWNVVQEGVLHKDMPFLNYPNSLAGKTIQTGTRRYCPDVTSLDQAGAECADFQKLEGRNPDYKSLVCFPVNNNPDSEPFAALCFDSQSDHAFDNQLDVLSERIKKQMDNLNGLLLAYRNEDKYVFKDSQPCPSPSK